MEESGVRSQESGGISGGKKNISGGEGGESFLSLIQRT